MSRDTSSGGLRDTSSAMRSSCQTRALIRLASGQGSRQIGHPWPVAGGKHPFRIRALSKDGAFGTIVSGGEYRRSRDPKRNTYRRRMHPVPQRQELTRLVCFLRRRPSVVSHCVLCEVQPKRSYPSIALVPSRSAPA